jgi:hypothetical protein
MKLDSTSKAILFGNIVTIFLAVFLSYDLSLLVWLYWAESIIIGIFAFLKLLTGGFREPANLKKNSILAVFFAVHYGMFHFGYFIFLSVLPWFALRAVEIPNLVFGAWVFLATHAYSFYRNVFLKKDEVPAGLKASKLQFIEPYSRIVPMHLTIILSGIVIAFFGIGTNIGLLLLFMALKTVSDLYFHKRKNRLV